MTIWLLALVLLASLAGLGYRQGAIRVGVSLIGILVGAGLAIPLGKLIRPLFVTLWIKDPLLAWVLPPVVVFIIISMLFKAGAAILHQKVDVHYKYRAGDLRLILWERLNHRLGLCLGLLNATAYLVLISFIIYAFSYWTVQMSTAEKDPTTIKILNRMGQDLQATGFHKVARSIDRMPPHFYGMADVAGLIYHNSLLEARLSAYPGFFALAELPEFKNLAGDTQFLQMRQGGEPMFALLNHPTLQGMIRNPELLNTIWSTVLPNLEDLRSYLETGKSAKYDPEVLLGRWRFNINAALGFTRMAKPDMPSTEMRKIRRWVTGAYERATIVAMPGQRIIMKNMPPLGIAVGAAATPQNIEGKWTSLDGGRYNLSISNLELTAKVEKERMTITGGNVVFVFNRTE